MGSSHYEAILSTLSRGMASSEERLMVAVENYSNALHVLRVERHGALSHAESGVLRVVESIAVEALHIAAIQAHAGRDHANARRLVDIAKRIHDVTLDAVQ